MLVYGIIPDFFGFIMRYGTCHSCSFTGIYSYWPILFHKNRIAMRTTWSGSFDEEGFFIQAKTNNFT